MLSFSYTAKDKDGGRVEGKIEAESHKEAASQLSENHSVIYRLEEESKQARDIKILTALAPVQLEDIVGFSQAVASMAEGGISLKRTVDILLTDSENATVRRVFTDISEDLSKGITLAQALSRYPSVFPSYYVAMTEAGENSGNLPEMMRHLVDILTSVESLGARTRSALSYPLLLFGFTLLSFLCFFAYGTPYLEAIYQNLGVDVPILTQLLISIGVSLSGNIFLLLLLLAGFIYLAWSLPRQGKTKWMYNRLRLSLPILGDIYKVLYMARFTRTLSILYRSGLGMAASVRFAAATIDNEVVREELFDLSLRIEQGEELSDILRTSDHISPLAVGMVAAGEESGKLEVMLTKVADVYDMKSSMVLQSVRSRLEPTVMLALGVTVALLLVVLGWPLLNLLSV